MRIKPLRKGQLTTLQKRDSIAKFAAKKKWTRSDYAKSLQSQLAEANKVILELQHMLKEELHRPAPVAHCHRCNDKYKYEDALQRIKDVVEDID